MSSFIQKLIFHNPELEEMFPHYKAMQLHTWLCASTLDTPAGLFQFNLLLSVHKPSTP